MPKKQILLIGFMSIRKMFSRYSCVYCGDTAEDLDHVVPHSYTSYFSNVPRSYKKSEVVPCCKRCNTYLGNKMFLFIGERASYLYSRYTVKYKKILLYNNYIIII